MGIVDEDFVTVPSVEDMDDETFIKHFELRHGENLAHRFLNEPDRVKKGLPRRLNDPEVWKTYHEKMHEIYNGREFGPFNHEHREPS